MDEPLYLQRNFQQKEHLDSFCSGNIRLGLVESYRLSTDDTRKNPRDGYFSGVVSSSDSRAGFYSASSLGLFYMLSFSTPETSSVVSEKYGSHSIRILNYKLLFQKIINQLGIDFVDFNFHSRVEYKNNLDKPPETYDLFFTNGISHSENCEYRFLYHLKKWPEPNAHAFLTVSTDAQATVEGSILIPKYITVNDVDMNGII